MTESIERFTIEREESGGSGQFVLTRNGVRLGALDYTTQAGILEIEYVEVAPAARGSGLGRRLVEAAVRWARETRSTVVPTCPYSRSVIEGDPALRDVLR